MIAQVTVSEDGAVTATVDSDDYAADDDTRSLMGLQLDAMLEQAAKTAISSWLTLHGTDDGPVE